jgi:hypothetical protein
MKYFNHLSCAGDDSKVQALREEFGLEGYAAYFLILEKIASQIRRESGSPSLSLSLRKWADHLDRDPRWVRRVLQSSHEVGLFIVEIAPSVRRSTSGDTRSSHHSRESTQSRATEVITITAPNLLKYADEYSKKIGIKSRHSPDTSPDTVGIPVSKEVRKDKRSTAARSRADGATAPESTSEIEDPKARAEAMKVIRAAMKDDGKPKVVKSQNSGNGKIPRAEGPEVEDMGVRLQAGGFAEPLIQDILDAWWAHKQGTHDIYAMTDVLDKHNVKGHDRSKIYSTLGVV